MHYMRPEVAAHTNRSCFRGTHGDRFGQQQLYSIERHPASARDQGPVDLLEETGAVENEEAHAAREKHEAVRHGRANPYSGRL